MPNANKRLLHIRLIARIGTHRLQEKSAQMAKPLRSQFGIGPETTAILLSIAGNNSE
jgi:hypothetical protein